MLDKNSCLVAGVVESLKSQGIGLKRGDENLDSPELHEVINRYIKAIAEKKSLKEAREVLKPYFNIVFE